MQHLEACVTLSPGLQWVQVDLGEEKEIHAVCIWHCHLEHSNQRAYRAVICRISSDPDFADGAVTVFNNDYENSAGFGKGKDKEYVESPYGRPFATGAVKGRYVRCYSNGCFDGGTGNDQSVLPGNHYTEIEVYGRGGKGEKHDQ
ncbi:MAG: hypothetical protein FWG50_05200 [Kiritimatiellaeota bacterium]|nr:hypothetical protein [Kiritimatiellota bacterium]